MSPIVLKIPCKFQGLQKLVHVRFSDNWKSAGPRNKKLKGLFLSTPFIRYPSTSRGCEYVKLNSNYLFIVKRTLLFRLKVSCIPKFSLLASLILEIAMKIGMWMTTLKCFNILILIVVTN